ncbi:hypothetical protein FOA52_001481 [Chlamydomonas sp. UWO 241]|nr:hypothetical protein FOA52_001481 [Chlamydomonas sp. UWO 241]
MQAAQPVAQPCADEQEQQQQQQARVSAHFSPPQHGQEGVAVVARRLLMRPPAATSPGGVQGGGGGHAPSGSRAAYKVATPRVAAAEPAAAPAEAAAAAEHTAAAQVSDGRELRPRPSVPSPTTAAGRAAADAGGGPSMSQASPRPPASGEKRKRTFMEELAGRMRGLKEQAEPPAAPAQQASPHVSPTVGGAASRGSPPHASPCLHREQLQGEGLAAAAAAAAGKASPRAAKGGRRAQQQPAGGAPPPPPRKQEGGQEPQAAQAAQAQPPAAPRPDPRVSLWHPPASPFSLLEEVLYTDPWRLLLACMLLNRTSAKQVRLVLGPLFAGWPTARAMADANASELEAVIHPLGLFRKRSLSAIRFSQH